MWTKILNAMGFETKAQIAEQERLHAEILRQGRANQARRRAEAVITTNDVPGKREAKIPKPIKPTGQVRAEHYGRHADDSYLTPGFNAYYIPAIVDTVFVPQIDIPVPEPVYTEPTPSYDSPAYDYPSSYSDSGSTGSYDPPASSTASYDPPASTSYDSGSSSSYDSGSSSSYDSGSSGGGDW